MNKLTLLRLCILFFSSITCLQAQLDTIHWVPPLHARGEDGPQYLYLSTPEIQPFQVTIRDGAGDIVTTATISNTMPFSLSLGNNSFTKTLISIDKLHEVLDANGLVIDGPKPFYAYFRVHSTSQFQAGDLTCKGRAALGKTFRIGHLLQGFYSPAMRCNFFGMMASEDSTVITVSEWEPGTRFIVNGADLEFTMPFQLTLQKGQTVVCGQHSRQTQAEQAINGFMGTLVTSTKPIVINCGSWTGAPVNFSANDIGIDQIVPVELVGKEYILNRGNGSEILERPIIVAHFNDTKVFLNGSTTATTTLQAGDWIALTTNNYSAAGNMYIQTSQPAYIYQMVGGIGFGDDQYRTAGLIFVPPLSCGIPNTVDNIYLPNQIGAMDFDGGMMITAMRDSAVEVRVDGIIEQIGAPATVPGNPDFVTYRPLTLFDQSFNPQTVSVTAKGAVQVALFGRNQPASFAGFFSGFTITNRPKLSLDLIGDGVCPDTLMASGLFDGVQWMLNDSLLQYGPDSVYIAYTPGEYVAIGYLGVCRRTDFAPDTINAVFNSPVFPYEATDATCFGFTDGSVLFGTPSGGIAPYSYSVDNGQNYTTDPFADQLGAGTYKLVVRDSTGCYNSPLQVVIGSLDSFSVVIAPIQVPDPLISGTKARFIATPDRPIISSMWEPLDSTLCPDCLDYRLIADQTIWVSVTVYDTSGCPATDRILVEVTPNIYAPNVLKSSSTDGNDAFTLYSRDPIPILSMRIYDRWGELVFDRSNFTTNDVQQGWTGTDAQGRKLNPAVFVWVAEVELTPGSITVLRGDVTLVR
jgi:IgGFc binding protein/CHU_C Type IX secretion signal domain/SprB repeat